MIARPHTCMPARLRICAPAHRTAGGRRVLVCRRSHRRLGGRLKMQFMPRFAPSVASRPAAPDGRARVARSTHFQENRMRSLLTFATLGTVVALAGCAVIVMPDDAGGVHYETAFGGSGVDGNGQHQVERREVAAVNGLDVNGPLQVEVRVGPAPSLQLDADSNLLSMVKTDTSGDRLRIWIDGSIRSSYPVHVVYTTPHLARIDSSGSGALTVSGLNGGVLTVSQNGSRSTELSGVVAKLDVSVNGSGGVNAAGLDSGSPSPACMARAGSIWARCAATCSISKCMARAACVPAARPTCSMCACTVPAAPTWRACAATPPTWPRTVRAVSRPAWRRRWWRKPAARAISPCTAIRPSSRCAASSSAWCSKNVMR